MIICDKCNSRNIDFVEIKSVEYQSGNEYEKYEDIPYCVDCFEKQAKFESDLIRYENDIDSVTEGAVDER